MARYSYNGTVLPELPDASGHMIIWFQKETGHYILACAKSYIANSNTICVLPDETVTVYAAVGNEWVSATWDKNQDVDDLEALYPDLVFFLAVKGLAYTLWANTNIYYVDVEDGEIKTTTQVAFEGTAPEYYSPDIPTASLVLDRNNDGDGDGTSGVIALEEPGWHNQARLRLTVSELESGATRKIVWYVDGEVFEGAGGVTKPICDSEGTYSYYVTVTDTGWNGNSVSCTSNTVTITVKDYDLGSWGTDDFEGDSDNISPYPEDDPDAGGDTDAEAEVPTILSFGANAMYDKGETAFLSCVAMVSDGGELSYEWHEDGSPAYDTAEINLPTDEYGKKTYFCVVTNTLNGSTASAVSDTITITVWSHKRFQSGIVAGLACDGWHKGETAEEETEIDPFLQGVEIGRKLKAKRLVEPIAYLYGNVRLPKLPNTDLQYAVIEYAELGSMVSGGQMARLILSSNPMVYTMSGLADGYNLSGDVVCYAWANHEFIWEWSLNMDAPASPYNEWVKMSEEHFDETTFKYEQVNAAFPKWANFELRYVTTAWNRVICSATDPIPVYE